MRRRAVINEGVGGFSLSKKAAGLICFAHPALRDAFELSNATGGTLKTPYDYGKRSDRRLVAAVILLGERASVDGISSLVVKTFDVLPNQHILIKGNPSGENAFVVDDTKEQTDDDYEWDSGEPETRKAIAKDPDPTGMTTRDDEDDHPWIAKD